MSQRLHVCKKCGKKFATLKGVYGHQRIHSGNYNRIEDDNGLQKIWGLKKSRVCSVSASDRFKGSSFMTEIEKHEVIEAAMNLVMLSRRVYDFASIRNLPLGDDFMDLELKPSPLRSKLPKKTQSSYKCRICDKSFVCSQALGSHQRLHRSMKGHLVRKREYFEDNSSLLDSSEAKMIVSQPSSVEVSQEKILHCAESKLDDFSEQLAHSDFDKSSSCSKTRFSALHSPMRSKSHFSYRFKICGKSFGCSQALGGHQTLHRSIRGQLTSKKEYTEDENLLSDSLEAKNIVTQPSSFEVSEEKKSLQCVEPKLEFHELLAHSGFDKSSTFSKTRFTALPSAPDAKKSVSQPSSFEASVDENILHRVEQKLEFSKQLPHSWFDKSSSCSKTNSWQHPPAPAMQPPEMNQSTAVDAYYASYCAYYANPDPNFNSDLQTHESLAIAVPPPPGVVDTTPYYTLDTNAQNLAWQESVRMYSTDPLSITGPDATGEPHSLYPPGAGFSWTGHIVQAQLPGLNKVSKKGKVVRSAYCKVCKVDCNGPSVFEQHILGKKHLKNLEKLKTCLLSSNTDSFLPGPTVAIPLIGPQENPCKSNARKKGAESTTEDLETKRRRVVECGVSNESIRLCRICNVVCNSDTVYNDHLDGQKHATKAAKAPVNT
ncbi:unnamed protein product [Arabidopsis arenosa]|uniref:C2H2-type domain-containing protein n=1 Tax=Arabidopsis arenosa TaxID=38785 RepID=A0A8S2A930_ARAAE|nr:unnamed protein product [Arabidopsis arenosa]